MFTFFSNIRIQTEDRLDRLKVCLSLLTRVNSDGWVFNLRGKYKQEAANYISSIGLKNLAIHHLESNEGWCADTLELVRNLKSEFIVFVVEDQFFISNPLILENTISEMSEFKADHLVHSWFTKKSSTEVLDGITYQEGEYLNAFELNLESNIQIHKNYQASLNYAGSVYSIALISVIRVSKLIEVCTGYRLDRRRFGPMTPFDVERSGCDVDLFPIRTACAKSELFASLDDDNIVPGSSLHQRGMFRKLASRIQIQAQDGSHPWLYHDLNFIIPKILTNRDDVQIFFRTYKYLPRHNEFSKNFSILVGSHLNIFTEAMRLCPDIEVLLDYESLAGLISLLFLKVFQGKKCTYRSADDRQGVRAHENIFLNRVYSGYKIEYIKQMVSNGQPTRNGEFSIYADYTKFVTPIENPNLNYMVYLDLVEKSSFNMEAILINEMSNKNLKLIFLFSELNADQSKSTQLNSLHEILNGHDFCLHISQDFNVTFDDHSSSSLLGNRRCALYRRQ